MMIALFFLGTFFLGVLIGAFGVAAVVIGGETEDRSEFN